MFGWVDFFFFLIELLLWPYHWWKNHNENSHLGTSPIEREAETFWLKFALFGFLTCLIIAIVVRWLWF